MANRAKSTRRKPKSPWLVAAELAPLLALGAWQMGASLAEPGLWWLRWMALIPLFLAIRFLPSLPAGACGAFWGGLLYLGTYSQPSAGVYPSAWLLLMVVPGCFAALTAGITRRHGFHPLWLGLCWALVELFISPIATKYGFLASSRGDGLVSPIFGHLTGGYLVAAFLLAVINATLLNLLIEVDRTIHATPSLTIPTQPGWVLDCCTATEYLRIFISRFQSRAPPYSFAHS